ncbi:MAG: ATP-binding protein [Bacteroidales bacterium]|nr:ATP-binding protein [Bacteroidales bacterium]
MFRKTVIMPSNLETISNVERIVDEISEQVGVPQDLYGKILIATIEAVNNAISHGNNFAPDKHVKVGFCVKDNLFTITVEDDGNGFNPAAIPDPTAPENIEKISGRGVFIMRQYADTLEFNETGTKVSMSFLL